MDQRNLYTEIGLLTIQKKLLVEQVNLLTKENGELKKKLEEKEDKRIITPN